MAKQIVSAPPARKAPVAPVASRLGAPKAPTAAPKNVKAGGPPAKAVPKATITAGGPPPRRAPVAVVATPAANGAAPVKRPVGRPAKATIENVETGSVPAHILAAIETAKATIQDLTAKLAAAKAKAAPATVTPNEARMQADALRKDDWRRPYLGFVCSIARYQEIRGIIQPMPQATADNGPVRTLLALPQDGDRNGAKARAEGAMALFVIERDGDVWEGPAAYIYRAELEGTDTKEGIYLGPWEE